MCPRHFLQAIRISAAESKRLGCERPRRRPHSRWAVDGGVRDQPRRRRQMPGPISVAAIEHNGKPQMAWRNRRKTGRTMGRRPPRRLTLRVHVPAALSPGHLMPIMPAALPPGHLTLRRRRGYIQRQMALEEPPRAYSASSRPFDAECAGGASSRSFGAECARGASSRPFGAECARGASSRSFGAECARGASSRPFGVERLLATVHATQDMRFRRQPTVYRTTMAAGAPGMPRWMVRGEWRSAASV